MNTQKPQPLLDPHPAQEIEVHSIFYTVQGEGPFAGEPAVFVRLAGCNLKCRECDTVYTGQHTARLVPPELLNRVQEAFIFSTVQRASGYKPLVVVTGGEPLRQPSVGDAIAALVDDGYRVQLETNGTVPLPDILLDLCLGKPDRFTVVCSPKTSRIDATVLANSHLKFVLEAGYTDECGLPTRVLGMPVNLRWLHTKLIEYGGQRKRIYVQPLDTGDAADNAPHLAEVLRVSKFHGYHVSLQLHKLLGAE